jgi:acyl transferase domain-containing protein
MATQYETTPADIAVIGMACRLPGAEDPDQYWRNVREGVESITFFSDEELRARCVSQELVDNPRYVKAAGVFRDGEGFDAAFFGYTAREAEIMDPQHRHFLEVAYHALEDAGYDPAHYGGRIGVYGGCTMNTYLPMNIIPNGRILDVMGDLHIMLGGDKEYLPARVSYKLDLTGPSMAVQTACSSSLTAIHVACQAILNGECDMALAGGSSVRMPFGAGYVHIPGGTSSADGHCRAFDAASVGSVVGNGAGVVMLKHLSEALADGDHIYAVIKGTSINNDGSNKVSFTAPSVHGQARAVASALLAAELTADDIGYVEAHGTGTQLGDPIEVTALTQAFRETTDAVGTCALGSVKPNIGHLDAGAGVASFIKATQVLRHGMVPPVLHFKEPNPQLGLEDSPFFVNNELIDWPGPEPRRAGVNSLGMGGSNAHVILEQPPAQESGDPATGSQLLLLSAQTATALETMSANLVRWLAANPGANFADVAYTLQTGRKQLRHRRAVAVRDVEDASYALGTSGSSRVATRRVDTVASGVALLFQGQGAQHPGMAAQLYETCPAYREAVDECLAAVDGDELRHLLLTAAPGNAEAAERLRDTAITQPALFVVEYAAAALLRSLGIEPVAMLGHSLGEYVAAVVAGVLTVQDGMRLVTARARLMSALPAGGMVSVPLSPEAVLPYLEDGVGVAAVNAPELVTVSGPDDVLARVVERLEADSVRVRRLAVSHAFHSAMMDAVLDDYRAVLATVEFRPPKLKYVSNVTGTWITEAECTDPEYWVRHLREPVRFAAGCATLATEDGLVVFDAGPGTPLLSMIGLTPGASWTATAGLQSDARKRGDGVRTFLQAVGTAWTAGIEVDFAKLWQGTRRKRVPLPGYPFEHRRYWLSPAPMAQAQPAAAPAVAPQPVQQPVPVAAPAPATPEGRYPRPDISAPYASPRSDAEKYVTSAMAEILGFDKVGVHDNFFEFDADSLMALQLVARLRDHFGIELPVTRIFENPSAARLSLLVEEEVKRTGGASTPRAAPVALEALARGTSAPAVPAAPAADVAVEDILRDADPADLARLLDEIEGNRR